MTRRALASLSIPLAFAACAQEPRTPESDPPAIDAGDDALADDPSELAPPEPPGESESIRPAPEPGPIMTTPVEPVPAPTAEPGAA